MKGEEDKQRTSRDANEKGRESERNKISDYMRDAFAKRQELEAYNARLNVLRQSLAPKLQKERESINNNEKKIGDLKAGLKRLIDSGQANKSGLFDKKTQFEILRDELEKAEKEHREIQTRLTPLERESAMLEDHLKKGNEHLETAKQYMKQGAEGFKDLEDSQQKAKREEGLQHAVKDDDANAAISAKDFYDEMKDDHYDAKFLLTDFETLKSKFDIQGAKLEALQRENEKALKNTLIGDYVDKKLKAEREGAGFCLAIKACAGATQGGRQAAVADSARSTPVPQTPAPSTPSAPLADTVDK